MNIAYENSIKKLMSLGNFENTSNVQKNIKFVIYGFIPHHEVRNIASGSWMHMLNKGSRGTEGKVSLPYASIKNHVTMWNVAV